MLDDNLILVSNFRHNGSAIPLVLSDIQIYTSCQCAVLWTYMYLPINNKGIITIGSTLIFRLPRISIDSYFVKM